MLSSGLGVRLKHLREAANISQEVLAARAGVSYSTISKLEQGSVTRSSVTTLQKIALALNTELEVLLSDKPLPHREPSKSNQNLPKKQIKFVYFDIGGVMAHTESMLLQHLAAEFDRPLSKIKALYHMYSPLAMRGKLQAEDIQLLFLFKLNLEWRKYHKYMFSDWVAHMRPNLPVHEFAREIATTRSVGLLTNIFEGALPRMQKRKLVADLPYKAIIESCKVGLVKPEKEIYVLASKLSGYLPSEILFIDDQKVNVKAARECGWNAEWFNETKTNASLERIRKRYF